MADPEFPRGGAPTTCYYLEKMHKNKENWTDRGRVSLSLSS